MRILVADDEPEMTMVLEALLNREHYSVDVVSDGQEALDFGLSANYDCIVLDIMMPKLDGIQALQALRAKGIATPVLLLTAKGQVEDRVAGLNSGADDYLPKLFDNREFIARVRALTRRGGEYTPTALTAGNITLDRSTFELKCGGSRARMAEPSTRPAPALIPPTSIFRSRRRPPLKHGILWSCLPRKRKSNRSTWTILPPWTAARWWIPSGGL